MNLKEKLERKREGEKEQIKRRNASYGENKYNTMKIIYNVFLSLSSSLAYILSTWPVIRAAKT